MPNYQIYFLPQITINRISDSRLMIAFPVECSPYQSQLPFVIRTNDDVEELLSHLGQWVIEKGVNRERITIFSQVLTAIKDHWVA